MIFYTLLELYFEDEFNKKQKIINDFLFYLKNSKSINLDIKFSEDFGKYGAWITTSKEVMREYRDWRKILKIKKIENKKRKKP